jgi:hypothetical protein
MGDPVYQSEWLNITSDAKNWLELGTGHQCADTLRWWYWGYGYAGQWYALGSVYGPTNGQSHGFSIVRDNTGLYHFEIDGIRRGTQGSSEAQQIYTGLESYSSVANVNAYTHHNLQYSKNTAFAWNNWSGRDNQAVGYPPMCGRWLSDTSWSLAQAHSC